MVVDICSSYKFEYVEYSRYIDLSLSKWLKFSAVCIVGLFVFVGKSEEINHSSH